jgi:hypothetical protein
MTTQNEMRTAIDTFKKEVMPLFLKEIVCLTKRACENAIPVLVDLWFYARWTLIVISAFGAVETLKIAAGPDGMPGIFHSSYEELAGGGQGTLIMGTFMVWMCGLILIAAPYIFHLLLIRRTEIISKLWGPNI